MINTKDQQKFTERNFLCKVLRSFITGTNHPDIYEHLNWGRLGKIVSRNGLAPILHFLLNADPEIPQDILRNWRHISIRVLLKYRRSLRATVKLFSILEEEKISAVTLRGMALAQWIYPNPALRPMADVDILVKPDVRHTIVDRLGKYGLLPVKILRSQFVYEIDNTFFEIHWSFLTPKRYRRAADFDNWIDSRRTINTVEGKIYCLTPENEFLNVISHAFIHHELDSLLKLVDIALLSREKDMDWEYIHTWCKRASMMRLFCFTLAFGDYLFDLSLKNKCTQFGAKLPRQEDKVFEAYSSRLFEDDLWINFVRRKKNLLFIAERPIVKLKQLLRLLSLDETSEFFSLILVRSNSNEHAGR